MDLVLSTKPYSDQHQFSPNNINAQSREKVMRTDKVITKGKLLWSFNKLSGLIFPGMCGDQSWEFICKYWGLGMK